MGEIWSLRVGFEMLILVALAISATVSAFWTGNPDFHLE